VDGCDVMAVYEAVSETCKPIRAGKGPALIELKTCRWKGHFEGDPQLYRRPEEFAEAQSRDPIKRFGNQLMEQGLATEKTFETIRTEVKKALKDAIEFADRSEYPPVAEIYTDLYYEERRDA
jgi:TPP-dependent pyruvate/acetoin dehydrogenase alpha subunit